MAKVQIKSEKLTLFGGIFQSWNILTPCFHLLSTRHLVRDAAVLSALLGLLHLLAIILLHHVEGELLLSLGRNESLAVEEVLHMGQEAGRRAEVYQNPWREAGETINLVEHLQIFDV